MQNKKKPRRMKGEKNVFCPHYRSCLDFASRRYWDYWSCSECLHRTTIQALEDFFPPSPGAEPYYTLSPSLYLKSPGFTL